MASEEKITNVGRCYKACFLTKLTYQNEYCTYSVL